MKILNSERGCPDLQSNQVPSHRCANVLAPYLCSVPLSYLLISFYNREVTSSGIASGWHSRDFSFDFRQDITNQRLCLVSSFHPIDCLDIGSRKTQKSFFTNLPTSTPLHLTTNSIQNWCNAIIPHHFDRNLHKRIATINLEDVTLEWKVICVLTLILQQARYHGVNWFHLAQNRDKWKVLVNMNLQIP